MFRQEIANGVVRVVMCNPPVNAISRQWGERLFSLLEDLQERDDWQVMVIASDQKVFSAGGDIKQYAGRLDDQNAGKLLAAEAAYFQELFLRIASMPQISIAEIAGVAAGGGLELALACDLRVAAETTKLGLPEVGIGLLPAGGGTQRMTGLVGPGTAMRLIGGAEMIDGHHALRIGLVEWAFPAPDVPGRTREIAARLAAQPPEALRAAKACIAAAKDPHADGYAVELTYPEILMKSAATRARIKDFLAARKPGRSADGSLTD